MFCYNVIERNDNVLVHYILMTNSCNTKTADKTIGNDQHHHHHKHSNTSPSFSSTAVAVCNHPADRVILTPEGEYICTVPTCGAVLSREEAYERNRYAREEAVGVIDARGKTNPWLLGLGSVIPSSSYAKVARSRDANGDHDSKFANVITDLGLERFGQELMDSFHSYSKCKGDHTTSAYLSIKRVQQKYGLFLDDSKVKEVIERTFNAKVQYVSNVLLNNYCKVAKHLGSKQSSKLLKKVIL
jgi:hypothetical protein